MIGKFPLSLHLWHNGKAAAMAFGTRHTTFGHDTKICLIDEHYGLAALELVLRRVNLAPPGVQVLPFSVDVRGGEDVAFCPDRSP